jgi:hypothetical protein
MQEVWKDIAGYEGLYQVSNKGRVRSLERYVKRYGKNFIIKERILSQTDNGHGYMLVCLVPLNGKAHRKNNYVHRLVAQSFIPNPNSYPEVNHIDEDKQNNNVNNLEWCSRKYNLEYGTRIEKIKKKVVGVSLKDKSVVVLDGVVDGKRYGIGSSQALSNCIHGHSKSSGGYVWRHA